MPYDKSGHFSARAVDGYYDCPIKIITSERGPGKTFWAKRMIIQREGIGVWLVRDSADFESEMQSWLKDLCEVVDDRDGKIYDYEEFKMESSQYNATLYFHEKPKVYFRILSMVNHIKHEKFVGVKTIVYDEFVPIKYKKLTGIASEGDALMDVLKQCRHGASESLSDLHVYLFANPRQYMHELFQYFHIDATLGYGVHRVIPGMAVWECLEPPKDAPADPLSRMAADVNDSRSWEDAMGFVGEIPKGSRLECSVRDGGWFFEIWRDSQKLRWVKVRKGGHSTKAIVKWGSSEGLMPSESCMDHPVDMRRLWLGYHQSGKMRYCSLNDKASWLRVIGLGD